MIDDTHDRVSLWSYLRSFTLAYVVVGAAIFAVTTALKLDGNLDVNSGMQIVGMMVSTGYPMQRFVDIHHRAMSGTERRRFSTFATIIALALSVIGVIAVAGAVMSRDELWSAIDTSIRFLSENPGASTFAIVFSIVLSWLSIYCGTGVSAKQVLKARDKKPDDALSRQRHESC